MILVLYSLNELDAAAKELSDLVTLRPLVVPLPHLGRYSLRPLGY